jgi:hypothetical protein
MENNKFQWGRIDEILMFVAALAFLLILASMNMPAEAIMTMGGSLMTIVPVYIKSALDRRNGNGNGNGNPPQIVLPEIKERTHILASPEVKKHHLRDEEM